MSRLYRRIDGTGTISVSGPDLEWEHDNPEWRKMNRREVVWHELWRPRLSLGLTFVIIALIEVAKLVDSLL